MAGGSRAGMVGSALSSAGARAVTLPLSAVFGLLTSKLVLDKYGVETFAYFGLLVSIIGLMSFTDFGVGAALNNTVAAKVERDATEDLARVLLTVIRTLCISSLLVLFLGAMATASAYGRRYLAPRKISGTSVGHRAFAGRSSPSRFP